MVSSASSQSQAGFFGQASKLLGSALGTSKKEKEVKKVLQMAAVAAKKVIFLTIVPVFIAHFPCSNSNKRRMKRRLHD
jgi:hypothetical protein